MTSPASISIALTLLYLATATAFFLPKPEPATHNVFIGSQEFTGGVPGGGYGVGAGGSGGYGAQAGLQSGAGQAGLGGESAAAGCTTQLTTVWETEYVESVEQECRLHHTVDDGLGDGIRGER